MKKIVVIIKLLLTEIIFCKNPTLCKVDTNFKNTSSLQPFVKKIELANKIKENGLYCSQKLRLNPMV